MQDGVTKGTGNSRYLKSVSDFLTKYPSYEDFAKAMVAGTLPVDFNGINEAGWSQIGTALNKANLLSDETAEMLGGDGSMTPDLAFLRLVFGMGNYGYVVRVTLADGRPAEGVTISGLSAVAGTALKTNTQGMVYGFSSKSSVSIGATSNYLDAQSVSGVFATAEGWLTEVEIVLPQVEDDTVVEVSSSGRYRVSSSLKDMDVSVFGGGGSGGGPSSYLKSSNSTYQGVGGGGGGGGYVGNQFNISAPSSGIVDVIVGAGGSAPGYYTNPPFSGLDGNDGGSTTVTVGGVIVAANGGKGGKGASSSVSGTGGAGNGYGGAGSTGVPASNGGNGAGYAFNDSSAQGAGGGGGGGGGGEISHAASTVSGASGGSPNGGTGSGSASGTASRPTAGGISGGGGGGGISRYGPAVNGPAAGGAGRAYFKFRHKS